MPTGSDDENAGQGGQGDEHRVRTHVVHVELPQDDASDDAHESVGAHHHSVGREPTLARADSARQVGRGVRDEGHDERHGHEAVALEELARGQRPEGRDGRRHDHRDGDAEGDDAIHHRGATQRQRPAVSQGTTHLLLERQEESRRQSEGGEPQRDDGLEVVLAQGLLTHLEERVAGDAGDEQSDAHRDGSLRKGHAGRDVGRRGGGLGFTTQESQP